MTDNDKKPPLPPIFRAQNLLRELHMLRAMNGAEHQMNRTGYTDKRAPDLVLIAPSHEERELLVSALIEQIRITEAAIKKIIEDSSLSDDHKDKLLAAIDAGEWVEDDDKKDEKDEKGNEG